MRLGVYLGGSVSSNPMDDDSRLAALQDALRTQFAVGERVGAGQFSFVYRATDRNLGREVAIKLLRAEVAAHELVRALFQRSAFIAAQLEHPHILRVLDFGEAASLQWMVMPLVEGGDLAGLVPRAGRLDRVTAVRVLEQLGEALGFSHAMGVIHRDIRPQHLLMDGPQRDVRLIDFTLARVVESRVLASAPVGTPAYMSPEQAAGSGEIDPRSDLYSLGVLGYELLTGALPFEGTAEELAIARLTELPRNPVDRNPDVPPEVAAVVMRCLAKHPDQRWRDAAEFLAALRRAIE
jgi:serine/threonine-protein kinase